MFVNFRCHRMMSVYTDSHLPNCFLYVGPILEKFQFSVKTTSDFPMQDGGKVLFQRDWFIEKTAS